jgi:S-(hydroxymethyl)glutathione dehydrogenase/alcohol dehydrogenase
LKALVVHAPGRCALEEVSLEPPRAGEVQVRMAAAGVCHSDLSVLRGRLPLPLPLVLGHEGAGRVERVGAGVTHVATGDPVVLSFVPACGRCFFCRRGELFLCEAAAAPSGRMPDGTSRVRLDGRELLVMQQLGLMAEAAVVPATSAVRIDPDLPLDRAALVGCGVTTGVGAVVRTARVPPGASVAVFGCGGVGLSVVQGARLVGAQRIVAVDRVPAKLAWARELGATDVVDVAAGDPVAAVRERTGGRGVDYAFEAAGSPELMLQAYAACRRGGTVTLVGLAQLGETLPLDPLLLTGQAMTVKGCLYGDANPARDFPMLLTLYRRGRLDLDRLITRRYRLEEAPQALLDLEQGRNARGVIVFD